MEDLFALHAHNSRKDTLGETCGYWLEHVIIRGRGLRDFKGLVSYLPVPIDSIVGIQKSQVVSICWGGKQKSAGQSGQQRIAAETASSVRQESGHTENNDIVFFIHGD